MRLQGDGPGPPLRPLRRDGGPPERTRSLDPRRADHPRCVPRCQVGRRRECEHAWSGAARASHHRCQPACLRARRGCHARQAWLHGGRAPLSSGRRGGRARRRQPLLHDPRSQIYRITRTTRWSSSWSTRDVLTPAQAAVHPDANQITRALGGGGRGRRSRCAPRRFRTSRETCSSCARTGSPIWSTQRRSSGWRRPSPRRRPWGSSSISRTLGVATTTSRS